MSETPRQMLIFSVGKNRYAMDILDLREVGRMPPVEMEPGAPEGVLGIIRMHGRPVRVHDLARLLSEAHTAPGFPEEGRWIIVSRSPGGDCHWQVDAVDDIVDYDPERVAENDAEGARGAGAQSLKVIDIEGRLTYLLTPQFLYARERA